ncbi:tRNA-intron endonuclease [Massarina eburnea CBS 473.64]|uniref:tRNA-splicing endonuclease subunit Sen34 n=1 Tax=Massarina eburnea CBS 473.64 TaxID=1395130 RepID=A0A6A6SEQ7_9PLEO|nr:tRNA-intron endonuclease [Massarina eburnea CBS 473.64]
MADSTPATSTPTMEPDVASEATIPKPFPISHIAGRYLLFDVNVISYARRTHNITGVLIGTIPNLSQQNVFLGIPLELQPEEARVLVEQGHAFIVDDAEVHRKGMMAMSREQRLKLLREMDREGMELAKAESRKAEERSTKALKEKGLTRKEKKSDESNSSAAVEGSETSLFDSKGETPTAVSVSEKKLEPVPITPTTSYPPLTTPSANAASQLPDVPKSYPLFRYLHSKGYFTMPGLRFGCHYSVYPGDTLRFHSHYLATGLDFDEEFELQDVIGGGRLANRVKKAYLIGGEVTSENDKEAEGDEIAPVRTFSIEWAAM